MSDLEKIVADCLRRHLAGGAGGAVTIALSGGVDSMVLLDIAAKLKVHELKAHELKVQYSQGVSGENASKRSPMLVFDAMHVHHGLSANADDWADFCARECAARGVALKVVRVAIDKNKTDGQGVEGAARRARYAALIEHGASVILAAQHADDQAETVLHQLLRGTGLNGLAGMGEARVLSEIQTLLRPLLNVSRAEIEAYAAVNKVAHIEDESNADTAYTRNFLRHDILPRLRERFPHANDALARAARHAAESAVLLAQLAEMDLQWQSDESAANPDVLDTLPLARQTNALYHWLRWQGVNPPSQAQLEEWARQLFRVAPTDKPHQAGGHDFLIRRLRGKLVLMKK